MGALLSIWIGLVVAVAVSRAPYEDEAYYSFPAHSFLVHGDWGTREIESSAYLYPNIAAPLTRLDRRTYKVFPLSLFIQAGWYRVAGWGLLQLRLISVIFGVIGILSWFWLIFSLSANFRLALIATLLIAFDWQYISEAASGRMDMMAHTFGVLALAVYEYNRTHSGGPSRGCVLASTFLCCAAMVHPIAGIVCGVVFGVRYLLDREAWGWARLACLAAPIILTAGLFAIWISYDPRAFFDQLAVDGGFRIPSLFGLPHEIGRYLAMYGLRPVSGHFSEAIKTYSALTYLCGCLLLLRKSRERQPQGLALCIALALGAIAALATERTKWPVYGIYAWPWFAVLASYGFATVWADRKLVVRALLSVYLLTATAMAGTTLLKNTYRQTYIPAVSALARLGQQDNLVFAPPEFYFSYTGPILFDVRLGFLSGKRPNAIAVTKQTLSGTVEYAARGNHQLKTYLDGLIRRCPMSFENAFYAVYDCR